MPRSEKQKLKILYIAKYLWEQTDDMHGVSAAEIVDYLEECGISAELHSVYRDIALLRNEFGFDIDGGRGKKYSLVSRDLDYDDIRILAECVSATRFVPKGQAARLVGELGKLCSDYQKEALESETFVNNRTRTETRSVFVNAAEIRSAMRDSKKIKFKYTKATIDDVKKTATRRNGAAYTLSPYALLVNDGNLYMLAYSDWQNRIETYRVDRMKNVSCTDTPRTGKSVYEKINMQTYLRRVFGMYNGTDRRVVMEFDNKLLDTVVDRLGTENIIYHSEGKKRFIVNASIEVSPQFYAWIFGFGDKASIKAPASVVDGMKKQIEKAAAVYRATE